MERIVRGARLRLSLLTVGPLTALALAAALTPGRAAAFDPVLELQNFAKIQERNVYETLTPAFQARLQQQNVQDAIDLPLLLAGDPERNPLGNVCAQRKNECVGDARFYDWADDGYGLREPVLFTARSGAVISGNVWRTREGPAAKPGIVITTGSVQAPETLYWGFAAALAKRGYVVLTYDVQGQGRSDTFGEGADSQEGFPSQAGQPFYDGTEDALDFFLSTPESLYADAMQSSCGNANGGAATSHRAKQIRREGETNPLTGVRSAEPYNPFWDYVDPDRIGIAGHSLGAGAVSYIGQRDPRVKAIAALDNLRTSDGGGSACPARPGTRTGVPITKPSIGFSNDYGIAQNPYTADPNPQNANGAFTQFKDEGVDSMQVNIRGGTHFEHSFIPGNTVNQPLGNATLRGPHMVVWYTAAWMDKYVKCPGASNPVVCEQEADALLLSNRWRNDPDGQAVDLANDPNLYSFYLRSRFDFTEQDGTEVTCDDMRAGCANMVPDANPAYPANNYSFISAANTPDGATPASPEFTDTDPASPSDDNTPLIKGTAPDGSTVAIYANPTCTGDPEASGSAADFADPGLEVAVADDSTTTFYGTATDASETTSACSSSSITYVHQSDTSTPDTQIDSGPTGLSREDSPSFEFSSPNMPGAGFECRLTADGDEPAEFTNCNTPKGYGPLEDGGYTFEVRAVDGENRDATPATASFAVDATPPEAPQLTSTDPDSPADDNSPLVIGSAEAGSLVELYAEAACGGGTAASGTAEQLADPGLEVDVADDTTTAFSAVTTDTAGNTSDCSNSITYVEDSTAPPELPKGRCAIVIDGTAGNDSLRGTNENEKLRGGRGDDVIRARGGADCLYGGQGDDVLRDGKGKDTSRGHGGDDRLIGGKGKDRLGGGPGNDTIRANDGVRDRVKCGPGRRDRVYVDRKDKVGKTCDKVVVLPRSKRR